MTKFIGTRELCEVLQVSKATILKLVKENTIPHLKVTSTNFRFDLDKVITALEGS